MAVNWTFGDAILQGAQLGLQRRQSVLDNAFRQSQLEESRQMRKQDQTQFDTLASERRRAANKEEIRYREDRDFYDDDFKNVGNKKFTDHSDSLLDSKIPIGQFAQGGSMLGNGIMNAKGGTYLRNEFAIGAGQNKENADRTYNLAVSADERAARLASQQAALFARQEKAFDLKDRQASLLGMASERGLFNSPNPLMEIDPWRRTPSGYKSGRLGEASMIESQTSNYTGAHESLSEAEAILKGEAPLPDGSYMSREDRRFFASNPVAMQQFFGQLGLTQDALDPGSSTFHEAQRNDLQKRFGPVLDFITRSGDMGALSSQDLLGITQYIMSLQQGQQAAGEQQ